MPKFAAQIDAMGIPVKNFQHEAGSAFPTSPFEGQVFRRSDQAKLYTYLGGGWVQIDNSGNAGSVHIHAIADVTGLQAALDAKAPTANPTFTGTVTGVTKAHVGLANVDNTTDANKPVSTAQATALALKAPLASPAFTGTPTGITKAHVGLGNVDNTTDAAKPVSTATATALAGKAPTTHTHAQLEVTGLVNALSAKRDHDDSMDMLPPPEAELDMNGFGIENLSYPAGPASASTKGYVDSGLLLKANTTHSHTKSEITDLGAATESVAGLVPLATTAEVVTGTNTTKAATAAGVKAAINALVAAAPGALDTLDELANALGDDPNFATTITNALGGKANSVHNHYLTDGEILGTLPVSKGGTNASTAQAARSNLSAAGRAMVQSPALTAGTWSADINHNLVSTVVQTMFIENATSERVELDWKIISNVAIQVRADIAMAANALSIYVEG